MKTFDRPFGRHPHGGDEDLRAVADGDFDELVELAVGVVVVGFAGAAADLREGEVDAEGEGFVGEVGFEVVYYLEEL